MIILIEKDGESFMEKVKISLNGGIMKIKIFGDIDHHSAKGIREKIDTQIFSHKPKSILFDLSTVEFMDSSGLGLILGRFTVAKDLGASFKIINPAYGVKKVLELAGIDRLIKIEGDDKNEAC